MLCGATGGVPGGALTGGALTGGALTGGALTGGALTGGALTGGALIGWAWLQAASAGCPSAGGALTGCPSAGGSVTADDQAGDALTGEGTLSAGAGDSGVRPARAASSSNRGPICCTRMVGRAHSGCPVETGLAPVDVASSAAGECRSTPVCSSSSIGWRGAGPVGDGLDGVTDGAVCDGAGDDGAGTPLVGLVAAVAATTGAGGAPADRARSTGVATGRAD
ncbi:hypothetical protein Vse01_35830 [Micromonospora sediminimaris]|uniref:Uncharacterized protein n=1 Tax=Micromonospora sediminimaris TaxID=547162 RepID=A0A9W5UTP8_9ACTN|nr:hypothetical protein Vse01_35830 [Micromonospora sediminimaris]